MEISNATPSTGMTPTMAAIGQLATPSVDGAIPRVHAMAAPKAVSITHRRRSTGTPIRDQATD
jgi:hypothetical protein